jgi:hypothetical protein
MEAGGRESEKQGATEGLHGRLVIVYRERNSSTRRWKWNTPFSRFTE